MENLKGRYHSEVGIHWRIILEWILEKQWEVTDWIHLVQDRNRWQALVNIVMNLWVP